VLYTDSHVISIVVLMNASIELRRDLSRMEQANAMTK
jgi:hypothetical protein